MDSETKATRYVICPVCHKVNTADNRFCQFCWGAALNQGESYSEDELEVAQKKSDARQLKKKRIRFGIIGAGIVAALVLAFLYVINYTDLISSLDVTLNSDSPAGEWTMFRHDLLRSGSTGSDTIDPAGTLKWSYDTGAEVHSSPAVAGDTVYFGSINTKFYALDTDTGEVRWEFETGSHVNSSPSVSGGVVYFGSNDGNLYALNTADGSTVWSFKTKYPVRSGPAIADDRVYFGSDDYYLYALDIETGKQIWRFDTDSPAATGPVISEGLLSYGSASGYSYILEAQSGQRRLKYNVGFTVYSSPIMYEGVTYFTTTNGRLIAVDSMARTWLWEHDIRPYWAQAWAMMSWIPACPEQSGYLWSLTLGPASTTTPTIEDGILYLGSGPNITAVDLETRKILWSYETGATVRSSPAKSGSVIYAGSDDGFLYAVDAGTGELRWRFETGAAITSSPAVVDGVVYVGSADGKVYAIE